MKHFISRFYFSCSYGTTTKLSGVMETVFKAAMYEITRLVEESFLVEVTQCREQVESLKRRLKRSESRRKESEGDKRLEQRCADCGRLGISDEEKFRAEDKCLKLESVIHERIGSSQDTDIETDNSDVDQTKVDAESPSGATDSGVQDEKLDRLLKEETLHLSLDTNGTQEKWVVNVDETDTSGLPGPSKRFIDQKIPKCHGNWEDSFEQKAQSERHENSGDPSDPLFQSRYGMEDLGSYDKTAGYVDAGMMEMSNLDGFQGSPSNLGKELNYMEHFEEGVEALGGTGHQAYQTGTPRSRRPTVSLQPGSPSKANIDVSGELSCLLINEEGYLQDPGLLYSDHVSEDNDGRFQGQGNRTQSSLHSAEDICNVSNTYNDNFDLVEKNKSQTGGRSGRKHYVCQQCSMSFPDSPSLKAHKQTHRGSGQGSPYSCGQCGKTFTQASSLRVHQRIHAGEGHLCTHCGKGFPYFSDLKRHNCVQTGDKPYCCSVCGNKFSRLWNLKLHRRIHTQEKPHRCSVCEKSFTRADILKVHQRTHTGERPYCCSICGLSFKRLDHLKSHQRKHS
uniref:C2H2-type domain-containing protein n=1 Tax=Cynoglossus semilaevis TaxID=244447 RepID=A0A3P8VXH3_CYNSE